MKSQENAPKKQNQLLKEYFLNAYLIALTLELGDEMAELALREDEPTLDNLVAAG